MKVYTERATGNSKRIRFKITEEGKNERIGTIDVFPNGIYDIGVTVGQDLTKDEEDLVLKEAEPFMDQIDEEYKNGEIRD